MRGPLSAKPVPTLSDAMQERFWSYVDRSGGYGHFRVGKQMHKAQRVACSIEHDDRLDGGCNVLHACDTPGCNNPAHLSKGTPQDNSDDMITKKRDGCRGDRNWQRRRPADRNHIPRKLTAEQVEKIRREYVPGKTLQREIAEKYGVNQTLISAIVRRRTWSHV